MFTLVNIHCKIQIVFFDKYYEKNNNPEEFQISLIFFAFTGIRSIYTERIFEGNSL